MSNALVKLIFGCMMMAGMKRKARIKLEGIFGRRYGLIFIYCLMSNLKT